MHFMTRKERQVFRISIDRIDRSKNQPRMEFEEAALHSLAQSIRCNGMLQPISVRKTAEKRYELVAGERRLRAAKLAGLDWVPCLLVDCDDQQAALLTMIENLQRVDLNLFEEARGIRALIEEWGITQQETALRLGKKQSTIANKLRLLRLSEEEQQMILDAKLTERHARALLKLENERVRRRALKSIIERGYNVRQSEELIARLLGMQEGEEKPGAHRTIVIKDVRIFMNTIHKAVDIMRLSGIEAQALQKETDEYIECVVRIPKEAAVHQRPA